MNEGKFFRITNFKEGMTCTLCEKATNLTWTCERGTLTDEPLCPKCVERQCKARAASRGKEASGGQ